MYHDVDDIENQIAVIPLLKHIRHYKHLNL